MLFAGFAKALARQLFLTLRQNLDAKVVYFTDRELRNILERAAILCDGSLIAAEHPGLLDRASALVLMPGTADQ